MLGAPVANREWALGVWFERLAAQTRRPDALAFVHSGRPNDATWRALQQGAAELGVGSAIHHNPANPHQRHDTSRYHTLARCRNQLLHLAAAMDADVLVSLDTDVMFDDPATIERLLGLLDQGWDTASPVTWLHPNGEGSWAWSFAWWAAGDHTDPRRAWTRHSHEDIPWGQLVEVHIPMAATAMARPVIDRCRYRWHESGEDLGFAQDLYRQGFRCVVDTALKARHVWAPDHLEAAP